jgi:hypothetical protein
MNWDKLDEYEKAAYKWQYKMNGHFFTNLWAAIVKADDHNLSRLSLGFPIEVEAYRRYIGRNLWWTNAVNKYRGEGIDEREAPAEEGEI